MTDICVQADEMLEEISQVGVFLFKENPQGH